MFNGDKLQGSRVVFITCVLLFSSGVPGQTTKEDAAAKAAMETAKDIQAATGSSPSQEKLPSGDPCTIFSPGEVQKAFPGAKPGGRSNRLEKDFGTTECSWRGAGGQLVLNVQESYNDGRSAKEDALDMASGFVEPFDQKALKNVRIESFPSLGDDAAAFIEKADPKRGILNDGAILELRRGRHNITVMTPELPNRERSAALKTLEELGRAALKRLQ